MNIDEHVQMPDVKVTGPMVPVATSNMVYSDGDMKVSIRVGRDVYRFPVKQMLFLCALTKVEGLDEVGVLAKRMGVSDRTFGRWMGEGQVQRFMEAKMRDKVVKAVCDENWWLGEMVDVWNGDKKVTKNQIEAGKEIGMRVSPKVERMRHEFEDVDFIFTAKKEG